MSKKQFNFTIIQIFVFIITMILFLKSITSVYIIEKCIYAIIAIIIAFVNYVILERLENREEELFKYRIDLYFSDAELYNKLPGKDEMLFSTKKFEEFINDD